MRLNTPLTFNGNVQPIRYDGGTGITNPGTTATASGWGRLSQTGNQPNQLQRVNVNIAGNVTVANYPFPVDLDNQLAAGGNGAGPCFGDSGGPLWVNSGGQNFLVGITSFGPTNSCSTGNDPDIWTRVSSYCGWIFQQIASAASISGSEVICSSSTYSVNDQPNTNISWTSSYPNGVTISSNGVASRQNNYNGQVTLTATLSNNCNSVNISRTVSVGPPQFSHFTVNGQPTSYATVCVNNFASIETLPFSAASYNWSLSNPGNAYLTNYSSANTAFNAYSADCYDLTLQISNACGTTQAGLTICAQNCFARYTVFPNPAKDQISVEFENVDNADGLPDEIALLSEASTRPVRIVNVQETFSRKTFKKGNLIQIDVKDLPRGTYYLHIKNSRRKDKEIDTIRILLE